MDARTTWMHTQHGCTHNMDAQTTWMHTHHRQNNLDEPDMKS